MHNSRSASSRGPAPARQPFRALSALIASAPQHRLPPPASAAKRPRLPLPPARSGSRHHAARPQDPAPAARTARAPVAGTSAAPPALPRMFQPGSSLIYFRRQCGLGFDIAARRREILLQPFGPILLLPEMLQQLDIPPCNGDFAGQRLRPVVFLFRRLLRRSCIARRRLRDLHRFVVAARLGGNASKSPSPAPSESRLRVAVAYCASARWRA